MKKELLSKIFKKNLKLKSKEINDLKVGKKNIYFNVHKNWDSLNHVVILQDIEKKFKIKINDKNIENFNNFLGIQKYLKKIL